MSWDDALDTAEELLREAGAATVTAFSGSETNEIAYALGRLLRGGIGAHSAVLTEATSDSLDAFRLPLSAIAEAELVVVVGDDPVIERAPIVDLWIKEARRRGAEVVVCSPTRTTQAAPGGAAGALPRARVARQRARRAAARLGAGRPRLVGPGRRRRRAGRRARARARLRGQARLRRVPPPGDPERARRRGRLVGRRGRRRDEPRADQRCSSCRATRPPPTRSVRALAEEAERVIVITMFHELAAGWADLILPATGALERDGTTMNLEGRLQRLRRAVLPPCPDELAWISKLAARFDVEISPRARRVFDELAEHLFRRPLARRRRARRRRFPARHALRGAGARTRRLRPAPGGEHFVGALRLHRYRPLLSGPAVERVPELAFLRPEREIELSAARRRAARDLSATRSSSARTARPSSCARGSTARSSKASRASPRSTPASCTPRSRW